MARRSRDSREERVAVAIDKDKGSQYALKWAVDRLLSRGQSLTLLHVKQKGKTELCFIFVHSTYMAKGHCVFSINYFDFVCSRGCFYLYC